MEKRCYSCMYPITSEICPNCGADTNNKDNFNGVFLKPGTVLRNRFYIGKAIEANGEGVTYIGYDENLSLRVRLREFFPQTLCNRDAATQNISVNQGSEIQFKALLTDFAELSKQLVNITENNCLLKAKQIFSENSTLYTVYEDVEGISLTKYLLENAGDLSWEETENLFLPLLYTIKLINSKGIIHRGISPETIIVTKNHDLKLKGICTSAVRAINSELKPELFMGYAAPEQYQKCSSHGEWTDVYSISAVLYKTLTGTMPARAEMRDVTNDIIAPNQLNSNIPQNVSEAIVKGLEYDKAYRTLYIKDLIGDLYAPTNTANVHDIDDIRHVKNKKKKNFKFPMWLTVILITLPIMLGVYFVMYEYFIGPKQPVSSVSEQNSNQMVSETPSSEVSSEIPSSDKTSSESIPNVVVVSFIDHAYEDIIQSEAYTKMFTFKKPIEEYHETAPVGQVIKQDLQPDSTVKQGTEIQLTISKGNRYIQLPPIVDESTGESIKPEDYKKYLEKEGLKAEIKKIDDAETPSGQIVKLSESISVPVDREKVEKIIIYVAK